ncbi:MAG: hypothetical protein L6V84_05895 [Oscillospiraceae bacterium]|nr:MAG: hypothetical protein L6V84_05895 [Oscillospiraceae bacterium]
MNDYGTMNLATNLILLFQLTGMNPDKPETLAAFGGMLIAHTQRKKEFNNKFANQATKLILTNALKKDN